MASEPDPDRLRALETRLSKVRDQVEPVKSNAAKGFSQVEVAWRMVIELVSGVLLGLAIGFGLDWLFNARPIFLVIFVLLGFAAGVRVMLRTAQSMTDEKGR